MIRNVLVMKSGLVLFSREFANTVQQVREKSLLPVFCDEHKIVAHNNNGTSDMLRKK